MSIMDRFPRNTPDIGQNNWWTTSNGCIFLPTGNDPSCSNSGATSTSPAPTASSIPVTTVILPTTTFTSFSDYNSASSASNIAPSSSGSSSTTSASQDFSTTVPSSFPISQAAVCIGDTLDASADGILASIIVPSAIGLLIWLLFAVLRPRFRQVYGLREWFPPQDTRPKHISSSFWAFLFPPVPLVPGVSADVSDAGRSAEKDAELFPSDEQLTQRTLWISFLIVLGWSILGLAGALPLYMVNTPCQADYGNQVIYGGASATMHDMSLLRLLRLVDSGNFSTTNLAVQTRAVSSGTEDDPQHTRVRIIVLTVLAAVVALFPAMHKIIKELNRLVAYRNAWIQTKCANLEMGWLSSKRAPGFAGWGEKELKDFLVKTGIAASLKEGSHSSSRSRSSGKRRKTEPSEEQPLTDHSEETQTIDVHALYTIGDTERLSLLIQERDEILENLEIAETRYISSFRITTPDPSLADPLDFQPSDPSRPYISRPRPLGSGSRRKRGRLENPALAASSLAPTSFVAPSQYYRLRGVRGVNGGRFTGSQPSFSDSVQSRLVGSRFQEVNRNSGVHGSIPFGSQVEVDENGQLGPADSQQHLWVPDPRRFGPNYPIPEEKGEEGDWVDVSEEASHGPLASAENGSPSFRRPIRESKEDVSDTRRETFPFRRDEDYLSGDALPPHLRLQPSQPFVRPHDGVDFNHLGAIYSDITHWRSRLKAINQEIGDAQRDGYTDIAEGTHIKGWLLVGNGLRFLPGVELIEGRAKEDVRWDVLQNERTWVDSLVFWIIWALAGLLLAVGLTAAAGLALANAPEVSHYLPFLQTLWHTSPIVTGIATVFAPAVAATTFTFLALATIAWAAKLRGSASVSGGQLLLFRATFWILTLVAAAFLITVGALIFATRQFDTGLDESRSVANGAIYMAVIALALVLNVAIIFPGLLLLQPLRLWRVIRSEKRAITPRQRFRGPAVYPASYDPSYAVGACVLALVFASTFSLIFPLIGPAVTLLLLLSLIAHRFLVGYVYGRTHSQTGGQLSIYLIRRLGTLAAFQPILLGLVFLSRRFWIEGGVLIGIGGAVILIMEAYAFNRTRLPGRRSLNGDIRDALDAFAEAAKRPALASSGSSSASPTNSPRPLRVRGSMASVLEMMSITLAVMPSQSVNRDPVPLVTETIDDLTATERAARTNPNAPPRLPPLPFAKEELSGMLYAPELLASEPKIWLVNDAAGVARSEAIDLQKYHQLEVVLDVQTTHDIDTPRHSSSSP